MRNPLDVNWHTHCIIDVLILFPLLEQRSRNQRDIWCQYSTAFCQWIWNYYSAVIMGTMAPQITSLAIVYSTVYKSADQRKHQSSASLAFVRRIHRWPVNSPHKGPVTLKMFSFDDVIIKGTMLRQLHLLNHSTKCTEIKNTYDEKLTQNGSNWLSWIFVVLFDIIHID